MLSLCHFPILCLILGSVFARTFFLLHHNKLTNKVIVWVQWETPNGHVWNNYFCKNDDLCTEPNLLLFTCCLQYTHLSHLILPCDAPESHRGDAPTKLYDQRDDSSFDAYISSYNKPHFYSMLFALVRPSTIHLRKIQRKTSPSHFFSSFSLFSTCSTSSFARSFAQFPRIKTGSLGVGPGSILYQGGNSCLVVSKPRAAWLVASRFLAVMIQCYNYGVLTWQLFCTPHTITSLTADL